MSPANIFNMVDLPEPEGPTIAYFSPSLSSKFISLSTLTSPQLIERFFVSTACFDFFKTYIKNYIFISFCLFLEIKKGCLKLIYNVYIYFKFEKNNLRGFFNE